MKLKVEVNKNKDQRVKANKGKFMDLYFEQKV